MKPATLIFSAFAITASLTGGTASARAVIGISVGLPVSGYVVAAPPPIVYAAPVSYAAPVVYPAPLSYAPPVVVAEPVVYRAPVTTVYVDPVPVRPVVYAPPRAVLTLGWPFGGSYHHGDSHHSGHGDQHGSGSSSHDSGNPGDSGHHDSGNGSSDGAGGSHP